MADVSGAVAGVTSDVANAVGPARAAPRLSCGARKEPREIAENPTGSEFNLIETEYRVCVCVCVRVSVRVSLFLCVCARFFELECLSVSLCLGRSALRQFR